MNRIEAAAYGLALCYVLHDGEELLTYRAASREEFGRFPAWVPIPDALRRDGWSQDHVNVAVALIGVHWVGAAEAGRRTGGRSAWFGNALAAWGVHGVGHLVHAVVRRSYVTGAATAPLVVGYWLWARRELRRAGVPGTATPLGVLAQLPLLGAVHVAAEIAVRRVRS